MSKEQIFDLSAVPDGTAKITRLPDYPNIKRRFFELSKHIVERTYSVQKFHEEYVLPACTETIKISYNETRQWVTRMTPEAIKLIAMINANQDATETMTLLEKEQQKIQRQFEIRQDVTDAMWNYIKQLKTLVEDPELIKKITQKEMLELYRIIREEEDRAKGLSLKERSENRADAMFVWMVSQAKAGQLSMEDIDLLEDDVKNDLLVFKQENGIYQLPRPLPKIRASAKVTPA